MEDDTILPLQPYNWFDELHTVPPLEPCTWFEDVLTPPPPPPQQVPQVVVDHSSKPVIQRAKVLQKVVYVSVAGVQHRIRIVEYNHELFVVAVDLCGVFERKSNVCRVLRYMDDPSLRLWINVPTSHNHRLGQRCNILSWAGVEDLMAHTPKLKRFTHYTAWLQGVLKPLVCL